MQTIIVSIVTSLIASFIFWLFFTMFPEAIKYKKMRPIIEYDICNISTHILFFLQMAYDNRGMRPSVDQVKIKANVIDESEYRLMLQNKCLNESYLYDENKDNLIPIGDNLERLSKDICKGVEDLSFYHRFMSSSEILLLKKLKVTITTYSYLDQAGSKLGDIVLFPVEPTIRYMANNFKLINSYYYELNKLIFEFKYLDKDLNGFVYDFNFEKSRIYYEQGYYKKAYKHAVKISDTNCKNGQIFMCLFKLTKIDESLNYLEKYLKTTNLKLIYGRDIFKDSYDNTKVLNKLYLCRNKNEVDELLEYFHTERQLKDNIINELYRLRAFYEEKLKKS